MPSRNHTISVYPPARVAGRLGGYSSRTFNLALHCWSHVLTGGLRDAELRIPDEASWDALAWVFWDYDLDPEILWPAGAMAEQYEVARQLAGDSIPDLAGPIRQLTYNEAWAVLWAIRIRQERYGTGAAPAGWWRAILQRGEANGPEEI